MLMPPGNQNQYDFIMQNPQRPRRQINFGNSPKQRAIIVVVGLILLIFLISFANSFLNRGSKAHSERLTDVVKAQQEIVRVSTLAAKDAKDPKTRDYALNTKYSIQTSQNDVKGLLSKRGVNAKKLNKPLASSKNTKNDDTLKEGELNNRYDETYKALTNKQLSDYQKVLSAAFESSNAAEKKALTSSFDNAKKLQVKETATR